MFILFYVFYMIRKVIIRILLFKSFAILQIFLLNV